MPDPGGVIYHCQCCGRGMARAAGETLHPGDGDEGAGSRRECIDLPPAVREKPGRE
jgi:hypothetical protein